MVDENRLDKIDVKNEYRVSGDNIIFRYLGFEQFVYLVETKRLYLNHYSKWEDPNEGSSIWQEAGRCMIERQALLDSKSNDIKKIKELEKIAADGVFAMRLVCGTSWTMQRENDALWRIYSANEMGIQIQTTVGKLEGAIKNSFHPKVILYGHYAIGKVKYETPPNFSGNQRYENLLIKYRAFDHEKEIRVLIFPSHNMEILKLVPNGPISAFYAPFSTSLIDEITIDPRAPDWFVETVKLYCKTKNISKVYRSGLYGKKDFIV